jgi:hypothetical protein
MRRAVFGFSDAGKLKFVRFIRGRRLHGQPYFAPELADEAVLEKVTHCPRTQAAWELWQLSMSPASSLYKQLFKDRNSLPYLFGVFQRVLDRLDQLSEQDPLTTLLFHQGSV